jgi:DNA-binding beta-propeller fold protein YncE
VGGLLSVACEGPNRFAGPGRVDARGGAGAPSVEIEAPRGDSLTARPLGDSVLVRARVRDDLGVDSVRMIGVALRGDPALGTNQVVTRFSPKSITLASVRDTVLTRYLIATNDTTREVVSIVVEAFDADSLSASDTTRITVGGPSVELLNLEDNQSVQSGLALSLQMRAADPNGIIGVEFRISGAFSDTLRRSFNPALDSVRLDTAVVIPAGLLGGIEVLAVARNSLEISGQDGPARLRVVAPGAQDVTRPTLSMTVTSADRLETQDSVRVRITGVDDAQGAGVARAGVTVRATSPRRGVSETRVFTRDFTPPRTGTITETIPFAPFNLDPTVVPDTLSFEITAFLLDASGNCAAAVSPGQTQSLPCLDDGGTVTPQGASPFRYTRSVVGGRTVTLPAGGRIMDAAVDTVRKNLLLSNILRDRIEVFRLEGERFTTFIPVGSQPWGLGINRTGDTLLVANSGGTNVSSVYLGPRNGLGPMLEVPQARFLTPDVRLFDVERKRDGAGFIRYVVYLVPPGAPPSFTDRPQYLGQDFTGRVVYSTKTTVVGDYGTIRKAFVPTGAVAPEVVLFWEHGAMLPNEDFTGVANADRVTADAGGLGVFVEDHVPGYPDSLVFVGPLPPDSAAAAARALGSDAVAVAGRFSIPNLGFTDTTFVAVSGDRRWAVFGEGRAAVGRIIMYDAGQDRVSDVVRVTDLVTNAAERVRGLGLNYDGTLGVARGTHAYFFTTDLRLQGVASLPVGGAGAVLHPLHANARSLDNPAGVYDPNTHLAFVGTGERTIDIFDTFHFFRSGRIFIRDVVSGPLRAVLPFPSDNAGLRCEGTDVRDMTGGSIGQAIEIFQDGDFARPHPPDGVTQDLCVVLKLFGVTDSGGVVVIDVRKSDVLRNHPSRN